MKNRFHTFLCLAPVFIGSHAMAASNTWVGDTNVWDTATTPNWTSPTTWTSGDDAVFGTAGAGGLALTLSTVSAHNIDFSATGYALTGSTLTLTGSTPTITTATGVSATISSSLAGTAGLTKAGTGALLLTGSTPFSGGTAINQGNLSFKAPSNAAWTIGGGTKTIASGATMKVDFSTQTTQFLATSLGTTVIDGTLNLSGTSASSSGFYNINALAASGAGNIDITDGGAVIINSSGALNSFTGAIHINGTSQLSLQGGSTSNLGTYAVNIASGATFDLRTEGHTIGGLNGSGSVIKSHNGIAGTGLFTVGNGNGNGDFSGTMTDQPTAYNLVKTGTGTQILSGSISYRGTTTVNGGTLIINGTSTNSTFTVAIGGTLAGAGSIGKHVTVNSGGFLAPGSATGTSIGTLTVTGSNKLTLAAGSKTICEIQKSGATLSNDQLFLNDVTYGGTLEVTASGDALALNDEFVLIDTLSHSGTFGTITLPTLSEGLAWDLTQLYVDGSIKVSNLAAIPTFDLAEGTYIGAQNVTMTSESGTTVYYTFAMGSVPPDPTTSSASGTAGSGMATVNLPTNGLWTVKAFATKPGFGNSLVALATYNLISTPEWINPSGGYWSDLAEDAFNWQDEVVAEGSGIPADFSTLELGADTTVILDGNRTIGSLIFGDTGNQFDWILEGFSTLTLAGPAPSIAVNNQTATVTTPLAGTGGLVKTGAGVLILSGATTYTGTTNVNDGTLIVSPTINASGTILRSSTTTAATGTSTVRFDGSKVTNGTTHTNWAFGAASISSGAKVELFSDAVAHNDVNANGLILNTNVAFSGAGNLNKEGAGVIVLNNPGALNGFTGNLNVNVGQFSLQGGTTSAVGNFAVNVASGATLDIRTDSHQIGALNGSGNVIKSSNFNATTLTIGSSNGNGDFSGAMNGLPHSYALVKTGTGTQILSGALSYPAATTVNGGTLAINGTSTGSAFTVASTGTLGGSGSIGGTVTVNSGGTIAPGESVGTLTLGSSLTLASGSTYAVEITGVTTHDKVVATTISANGTIKVTLSGHVPTAGESFDVADGAITGTPAFDFSAAVLSEGLTWNTFNFASTGVIRVSGSGYGSWIATYFGSETDPSIIGSDADTDHDGVANGIEFMTGTIPNSGASRNLPSITRNGTGDLVVTFQRVDDAETCEVAVEYSTTLQTSSWTSILVPNDAITSPKVTVVDNGTDPDDVTVVIPASADPRKFARVEIIVP